MLEAMEKRIKVVFMKSDVSAGAVSPTPLFLFTGTIN